MHGSLQQNALLLESSGERVGWPVSSATLQYVCRIPISHRLSRCWRAVGYRGGRSRSVIIRREHSPARFLRRCCAISPCRYVLVGHSERRSLFGESDAVVAAKFVAAQREEVVPVLCLGETLAEREAGQTMAVVSRQLSVVIDRAGVAAFASAVLAYEPVWAIGTRVTASPAQAQEVHAAIRAQLAELDSSLACGLNILYGGSVKPQNAVELFAQADIDGGLIGGAALVADDFLAICQAAS